MNSALIVVLFISGPGGPITSATTEIIVPIFCQLLSVHIIVSASNWDACRAGGK